VKRRRGSTTSFRRVPILSTQRRSKLRARFRRHSNQPKISAHGLLRKSRSGLSKAVMRQLRFQPRQQQQKNRSSQPLARFARQQMTSSRISKLRNLTKPPRPAHFSNDTLRRRLLLQKKSLNLNRPRPGEAAGRQTRSRTPSTMKISRRRPPRNVRQRSLQCLPVILKSHSIQRSRWIAAGSHQI
jgi:hypothetical protein